MRTSQGVCVKSPSPRHVTHFAVLSRPDRDEDGPSVSVTTGPQHMTLRGAGVKDTGCRVGLEADILPRLRERSRCWMARGPPAPAVPLTHLDRNTSAMPLTSLGRSAGAVLLTSPPQSVAGLSRAADRQRTVLCALGDNIHGNIREREEVEVVVGVGWLWEMLCVCR